MKRKKVIGCILLVSILSSAINGSIPGSSVSVSEVRAANETSSVVDLEEYENNDIIVVYKKEANATKQKTLSICGISNTGTEVPEVSELTENSVVLKLDSEEELEEAVEALSKDSRVDYIQPNYVYRAFDVDITSTLENLNQNTDFTNQWAFYNDGTLNYTEEDYRGGGSYDDWWHWWSADADTMAKIAYGGQNSSFTVQAQQRVDIHLPEALSICATPKREVVVAFVDTGIKYDHSELSSSMWVNEDEIPGDGIDNDGNGYIDDIYGWNFYGEGTGGYFMPGRPGGTSDEGNNTYYNSASVTEDAHGTHGAGSVAAANDSAGIVGAAANANVKIMTVKALGGEYGYGSTESVVKGIQYAEENGAQVCNLSLGGDDDDTTLRNVIENSSMLFTIAAGNGDSSYNAVDTDSTPTYPSCYTSDNIINVANIQCDGDLHYTSNYGATTVDIAAPGSKIYSTSTAAGGYEEMTGTSMAAPIVAGVAAMIYSCYDNVTLSEVRDAILNSATQLSSLEGKCVTGGMVNAYDAIRYIEEGGVLPTISVGAPTVTSEPTVTQAPSMTPEPTATETPTMMPDITNTPSEEPTQVPDEKQIILHFRSPWEAAKVYYWDKNGMEESTLEWPGVDMEQEGDGWYSYTVNEAQNVKVIFNDGQGNKTEEEFITTGEWWYVNGEWYSYKPTSEELKPTEKLTITQEPTEKPTITEEPTETPTVTEEPTKMPTVTKEPTKMPTVTQKPTRIPTVTEEPTKRPTATQEPTKVPTLTPTVTVRPQVDFLEVSEFSVSGSGNRTIGKTYTISAKAKGGTGNYKYRFIVKKNGTTKLTQEYSSISSICWKPTTSGTYNIRVSIVDENGDYDVAVKEIKVASLKITDIKKDKSTLKKGVKVKLKASVSGAGTSLSYQFVIKKSGKTVLKKTTSKNYISWNVPSKGTYKVKITITDAYGNKATKTKTYKVKK